MFTADVYSYLLAMTISLQDASKTTAAAWFTDYSHHFLTICIMAGLIVPHVQLKAHSVLKH